MRLCDCRWMLVLLLLAGPAVAQEMVVERYPNNQVRVSYRTNHLGEKQGPYREFYEDGKPKIVAQYAKDQLQGNYKQHHPNGKVHVSAVYRNGQLHGRKETFSEDGAPLAVETYAEDKLHGEVQRFEAGRMTAEQLWIDGVMRIAKSPRIIKHQLAAIDALEVEVVGEPTGPKNVIDKVRQKDFQDWNRDAIRRLMKYRAVCGVPYEDLQLDLQYAAHAQAGSQLLDRVGELTHHPKNPGMPEEEFQFAYLGTKSSNIHRGQAGDGSYMSRTVDSYMNDSDPKNIEHVGHRRWCLNPSMRKTGFGLAGSFSAMWSFDRSRDDVPDYDTIAYPAAGFMPVEFFGRRHAWSVGLNPQKYAQPIAGQVKVNIVPVNVNLREPSIRPTAGPLELDHMGVTEPQFGGLSYLIFRPADDVVQPNKAFAVTISRLRDRLGDETEINYLVLFVRLAP